MGFALAGEAAALGADVTVVAANVALARRPGVRYVDVGTAAELQAACEAEFPGCDALLMAAAVADFRPVAPAAEKIKKSGRDELRLELEPTQDILSLLSGRRAPGQLVVGFAAEHGEGGLAYGRDKLARKGLDAIVVNDIARHDIGFEGPDNEVVIVTREGERHVPLGTKAEVARAVLEAVDALPPAPAPGAGA
jgi:phosphopantothenoylcysteine decarboxylase/phosphopantothenate--cysteine ligase